MAQYMATRMASASTMLCTENVFVRQSRYSCRSGWKLRVAANVACCCWVSATGSPVGRHGGVGSSNRHFSVCMVADETVTTHCEDY